MYTVISENDVNALLTLLIINTIFVINFLIFIFLINSKINLIKFEISKNYHEIREHVQTELKSRFKKQIKKFNSIINYNNKK